MSKLVKICANRIVFFTFISIILTLLIVYGIFALKIYISLFSFVLFLLILIYSIISKSKSLFILSLSSFIIFSSYAFLLFSNINSINIDSEKEYTIVGYIPAKYTIMENSTKLRLENCTIYDEEDIVYSGMNINFIYVGESSKLSTGNVIKFNCTLSKENLFNYGEFNCYNIPYNTYFTAVYFDNDLEVLSNSITLKDNINQKIKTTFENALDYNTSALAYAVTFGDKSLISSSVANSFRISGLAHILAVSGLHTTIIFLILTTLLKRCKIDKRLIGIIISIFLLIYAYLCSFSPSIVRASIMCLVIYFSFLTTRKPDMLNILGLSGIIILLINPLDLFNIGFCLSFSCMFGIIVLSNKLRIKGNLFKNLSSAFALTASTQIATFPFLAKYFGYFTFIGFVANIILLPLFTILFTLVIICAFISLFFTPIHLFNILNTGLNAFINLSIASTNLDFLILDTFKMGVVGIVAFLILVYVLSNKFFIKKNSKIILYSCLILIITISCIYSSLPKTEYNTSFVLKTTNSSQYFKLDSANFCFVNAFTSSQTLYETKEILNSLNENTINNLLITKNMKITLDDLKEFMKSIRIKNTYLAPYLYEDTNIVKYLSQYTNLHILEDMQTVDIGTESYFVLTTSTSGYFRYIINDKQYIVQ